MLFIGINETIQHKINYLLYKFRDLYWSALVWNNEHLFTWAGTENVNNICEISLYKIKIGNGGTKFLFLAIILIKTHNINGILYFAKLNYKIQTRGYLEKICENELQNVMNIKQKRTIILKAK